MWPSKLYTLQEVALVLELAPGFISNETKNIFVHSGNEDRRLLLLNKLQKFQLEAESSNERRARFQSYLSAPLEMDGSAHDSVYTLGKKLEQVNFSDAKLITENDWAVQVKLMMKDGDLLNRDDVKVLSAWNALMEELSPLYTFYIKNIKDKVEHQVAFLEHSPRILLTSFIAQLLKVGQEDAARTLHQFLWLIKCAFNEKEKNELDESKIGLILSATLGYGLNIIGYLHTNEPVQEHEYLSRDTIIETNEMDFLKFFLKTALNGDAFHLEYNQELYNELHMQHYSKIYENFQNLLTKVIRHSNVSPRDAIDFQLNQEVEKEEKKEKEEKVPPLPIASLPSSISTTLPPRERRRKSPRILSNLLQKRNSSPRVIEKLEPPEKLEEKATHDFQDDNKDIALAEPAKVVLVSFNEKNKEEKEAPASKATQRKFAPEERRRKSSILKNSREFS